LEGASSSRCLAARRRGRCRRAGNWSPDDMLISSTVFFSARPVLLALSVATTTAAMADTSICGDTRIPLDTSVFSKPFVNLTLGGDTGHFLLDTGATHSQIEMRRYGASAGSKIFLSGFSLPLMQSGLFSAADLRPFSAPCPASALVRQIRRVEEGRISGSS
jgi:hypothetical protein